ncbi:hypothetical protein V491_03393 [Pseudogymnoascus sp. VKM F-3775]|nr:hypothetical protein V491_03393 [Pseudogymnoascus sp. VKM F-3775]
MQPPHTATRRHRGVRRVSALLYNDLQAILNCKPRNPPPSSFEGPTWLFDSPTNYGQWNLDSNAYVEEVLRALQTDRNEEANGRINGTFIHKIAFTKANSRVHAIISSTPAASFLLDSEASISKDITAVKLVVTPNTATTPFCIEFEMKWQAYPNSCLKSIDITYCAMRPNNSEVFLVASFGSVELLRQLLTNESARLTDRDTEGRSLLADHNIEMVRFLVRNRADPNNFEPDVFGFMVPVFEHGIANDIEVDEEYRKRHVEYCKILLEGGADYSLLGHIGDGEWISGFHRAIHDCSVSKLPRGL